jgi:hypothetical protein
VDSEIRSGAMGVAPGCDYGIHELLIGAFVLHGGVALPPIDPCGGAVCFGRSDSEKPVGESGARTARGI